jgi:hypothetical protein
MILRGNYELEEGVGDACCCPPRLGRFKKNERVERVSKSFELKKSHDSFAHY